MNTNMIYLSGNSKLKILQLPRGNGTELSCHMEVGGPRLVGVYVLVPQKQSGSGGGHQ